MSKAGGKRCASDKRRNMLKSKLRELLRETEPIPESCLLECTEFKPEPEILAEVLLMSEAEGIDLADSKPDNVFDNLFADMSHDRSIAIASAAPEIMSDVVVPVQIPGQEEGSSVEIPNSESMIENIQGEASPNVNVFQESTVYATFTGHMNELMERSKLPENISELLGASGLENESSDNRENQDEILEYVIKPGPPSHVNRVRLNGSVRPTWFPGYNLVSPYVPGYTRVTNDPSEALKEAWKLCGPRHFDERSRFIVNIG